jgi:putative multiple sugar transport system substrate-binding protein
MFPVSIEAAGYKPQVTSAENKPEQQQQQIDTMIAAKAKVVVVGPVDGTKLGTVLENAKGAGALVLGYDRMIENTEAVDGVVQYGSFQTGVLQATALLDGLKALHGADGPWAIELFGGGPADPNARIFFDGAMSILQPLIDDGTITIASGQTEFTEVAIDLWDNGKAQSRMDSLIAGNYQTSPPDGVLSPNDGIARACLTSLENAGYDPSTIAISGLDAEDESIEWIRQGRQYSTVAKPTQPLIDKTLELVAAYASTGQLPEAGTTADNGVKDVPVYELESVIITKDNVNEYFPES